jgi:hypothetical protein
MNLKYLLAGTVSIKDWLIIKKEIATSRQTGSRLAWREEPRSGNHCDSNIAFELQYCESLGAGSCRRGVREHQTAVSGSGWLSEAWPKRHAPAARLHPHRQVYARGSRTVRSIN